MKVVGFWKTTNYPWLLAAVTFPKQGAFWAGCLLNQIIIGSSVLSLGTPDDDRLLYELGLVCFVFGHDRTDLLSNLVCVCVWQL